MRPAHPHDRPRVLWSLLALCTLLPAGPLLAQPKSISQPTRAATAPLPTAANAEINDYTKAWAQQLIEATSIDQIMTARKMLQQPLNQNGNSEPFNIAYAGTAAANLTPGMDKNGGELDDIIRLNIAITASELPSGEIAALCAKGLADKHWAVRFHAARAIYEAAQAAQPGQSIFNARQQLALITAFQAAMPKENVCPVLEQTYRALGKLDVQPARDLIIDTLNRRVKNYLNGVNDCIRAERIGISGLATQLVFSKAAGQNVKPTLKRLTAVSAKYLKVLALNQKKVDPELKPAVSAFVEVISQIFKQTAQDLGGGGFVQPKLDFNDADLLINTLKWTGEGQDKGILTDKCGIAVETMALPQN